jgi:hypothetical protein
VTAVLGWYAPPGSRTALGAPRSPPVPPSGAGGASAGLPAGAPAADQAAKVAISSADRPRTPRKSPQPAAGIHGGIRCVPVADVMAAA